MATADETQRLERLARDLEAIRRGGIARQEDIATEARVCQETVSKAKKGRLRRWTPAVEAIAQNASMRLGVMEIPSHVAHASRAFLVAGGRAEDLVALIDKATDLVTGRR